LQKPFYQGCVVPPKRSDTGLYILEDVVVYILVGLVVTIFLVVLLRKYQLRRIERFMEEENERRRIEEGVIESEFQGKLLGARKGSLLSVLPRTVRGISFPSVYFSFHVYL